MVMRCVTDNACIVLVHVYEIVRLHLTIINLTDNRRRGRATLSAFTLFRMSRNRNSVYIGFEEIRDDIEFDRFVQGSGVRPALRDGTTESLIWEVESPVSPLTDYRIRVQSYAVGHLRVH